LEASEEYGFSDFIDGRVLNGKRIFSRFHIGLRSIEPAVDERIPADISLVDEEHTSSRDGSRTSIL
jgi:UPF0288 family protein (methanogenesis marker protein 3)